MEFPGSNGDNQASISDVSSQNIEENPNPSSPEIPQPMEALQMAIADNEHEYGCKYCDKKFSNKQALGGHQNAHKVERAMEKNARELHENHFASYFGGSSSHDQGLSTTHFLGSYMNRSHDFVNRPFYNYPYNPPPQQHGIQIGYNARQGLPLVGDPYAPPQNMPVFNNIYSGWGATGQTIPQFLGQSSYNMQNHGLNLPLPNIATGSSSSRHLYHDMSGFPVPRTRPERDIGGGQNVNIGGGQNEVQMNDPENQQVGDEDIDLSLKL